MFGEATVVSEKRNHWNTLISGSVEQLFGSVERVCWTDWGTCLEPVRSLLVWLRCECVKLVTDGLFKRPQ